MDSPAIAQFLESTYPEPPVPLDSELGNRILADARSIAAIPLRNSLMPRELRILSPRAEEFFRQTREPALGHSLEELLPSPEKEDEDWAAVEASMRASGELMRTHRDEGPFVLGARPSYVDFAMAGNLQCARVIDEGVFERLARFEGYREVYEACLPWMERSD